MGKEIEPIQQIEQREDRVSQVLGEREALVDRIGTGVVKVGSSWENTLKVGRVRSKVRGSVNRLRGELGQLDQELNTYGQAREYLSQLSTRQTQLGEMSEMVAEGNLPQDVLQTYQQHYEELASLPERNPALQRGIERIRREEEARKREQGIEAAPATPTFGVPPRNEPEEVVVPPRVEVDPVVPVVPGRVESNEGKRGSERFRLPTGEEIGGKAGELLRLVAQGSPNLLMRSDDLARELYPGVDEKVARGRLKSVIADARKALAETAFDLVSISKHSDRRRGKKGGYYLGQAEQRMQVQSTQPDQVEIPAPARTDVDATPATGFQFEDGKTVEGEAGRLLSELSPFSSEHIVTYRELLRAVSASETLDDLQVLDQHLKRTKGILHQRSLRLAYVPNPRDAHNIGYYVESIRRPNVRITLLGDVIKYGNKKVRIPEEQYRLLWALTSKTGDPKFDRNLSARAFNEPNPEASPLPQVAPALSEQLTELTGVEGIIATGGNEEFGHFYKIKDATILRRPGYFPVHSTRLEALHLIFQDNPTTKHEVVRALGVTKGRKRASHPLTEHQALVALTRAVTRLRNRESADIVTDPEADAYLEMSEYMERHNLGDEKALLTDIARKLGISHNSTAHVVLKEANTVSSVELIEPETHELEETPKKATDPEFGTLSRADITMIAAAIRMHRTTLGPIAEQRGVKLVEEAILEGLVELRAGEPIADFKGMPQADRDKFINEYRIRALEKARELIESPDFDRTMEQIYEQNPDVWCLIFNLSEMNKVEVENGTGLKQGITFLKDLLANPEARRKGFRVIPAPQPAAPTPEPRQAEVATVQAESVELFDARLTTPSGEVEIVEALATIVKAHEPVAPAVEPVIEVPLEVTLIAPPVPIVPKAPEPENKPKTIEVRDPDIRTRVKEYLDEILSRPDLTHPVSPAYFTRNFPRIKRRLQDNAVSNGHVSTQAAKHRDQFLFDIVGMASLLYLHDWGTNLPSKLRRQVQDIVSEELKKRQE